MSQLFFFGASIEYGVGGESGGWADMVKKRIHSSMYAPGGIGETHEIYIFAKPGADLEFVASTFESQLKQYRKDRQKVIAIVSIGMNNSKAVGEAENFFSTVEQYETLTTQLLGNIKNLVDHIICVGFTPVNESKTLPKKNPLTGGVSYFSNQRVREFNNASGDVCKKLGIEFIDLFEQALDSSWQDNYLYEDGLHPNKLGHKWIFDKTISKIESVLN